MRGEQQQAADALLAHDNGILSATTAFGKTVVGAHLIAERKVNTLVLVHRTNLLSQWQSRLNEFLIINEEPITELTPKGRKRKKTVIGQIRGGKKNPSGIIDVAVMQSLVSDHEVNELVKDYGMVIVDECHHVSALSFEQVLKAANAKYVYGLTATPTRQDGHHPIIYMHCGKIRYRVDAKEQAEARPFEHFVIPRFTRFQKPAHQDESKWSITDIYNDIQNNELRNDLIIQDVVSSVEQGRNPIILTERTDHVKLLAARLSQNLKNVITLTGGGTHKKSREILQSVIDIPDNMPFVLVATGKYVGEGFDMPRLDTLFLAMPISWRGTLQQYAGRLHRLYDGKKEVQVYDYVDVHVAMLEKMYQKRLRGYASIGYKAKGTPQPLDEVHSIFDSRTFFPVYSVDVLAANSEVLIVSPFVTKRRVLSALNYLTAAKAKVTVITKPPENYVERDRERITECMDLLRQHDVIVRTKDRIHQKFAIMDQRVVWYGSINLLSYGISEESIMRIENVDIAGELLRSV
ncbi:MAG: DEAD/DEAH box helicase family protein [Clostridiales Family XIII bacterium]|nr:DEAD/DEAH box helicase family protein [Clostridiales Family XIII bacterium]